MRIKRSMAAATAAFTAAIAVGSLTLAGPASADPASGTYRTLVGVGSDTTQDVMNALAGETVNGTSYAGSAVSANGDGIASYDAIEPLTGSTTSKIQTRSNGTLFARPNGSGAGRQALSSSLTGTTTFPADGGTLIPGQVDFARSSGGPSVSGTGLTALTYVPYARDAVGVAVKGSALQNLTVAQLHDIYAGTLHEVNGVTVQPYLPQTGSGTRKFFLASIGLIDSGLTAPVVEENQANNVITTDGALVPFSVGSWIAQTNGFAPDRVSTAAAGGAYLANVQLPSSTSTAYVSPVQTVSGKLAPVADYYNNSTFGRDVYNVVPTRAIDPTSIFFNKSLYDIFVTSGTHTAALASASSEAVISDFGFMNESYNGSVAQGPSAHAKQGGLEGQSGSANTLPGAPALTAAPGAGSLKISWAAPTDLGLPVTDYRAVLTGPAGTVVANKDVTAATTSYTFTGLAAGSYSVALYADNLAGSGAAANWTGTVSAVKTASTTKASAPNTAYGQVPKVAVTVTGASVPTGKVTVKEGKTTLGTATLDKNGKASVALPRTLSVATHSLTVSYAGDSKLNASSATAKLTITKATPAVTSTAPATISHTKQAKVTVKVTATGTVPGGKVRIYEGTKVIATGTLSKGQVVITLPKLKKGKHVLHAFYTGSTTVIAKSGKSFTIKST